MHSGFYVKNISGLLIFLTAPEASAFSPACWMAINASQFISALMFNQSVLQGNMLKKITKSNNMVCLHVNCVPLLISMQAVYWMLCCLLSIQTFNCSLWFSFVLAAYTDTFEFCCTRLISYSATTFPAIQGVIFGKLLTSQRNNSFYAYIIYSYTVAHNIPVIVFK